jgi:hypothetical protein
MSLDIWMKGNSCGHCGRHDETPSVNITYNLSPMWNEIYPVDRYMVDIDGMSGEQSLPKLQYALDKLRSEKDHFEKLNPPNGWGTYQGFVEAIERLIDIAKDHPKGIWETWR